MHVIDIDNGVSGYREYVSLVLKHGEKRSPRGIPTYDAGPVTVKIHDLEHVLPLGIGRNVNRAIAAAEAVQLIGGFSDPRLLTTASPNFNQFTEPDGTFYGAYGNRIASQLIKQVRKIERDRNTRQAVITLWDSQLDNAPGHRDYPCTIALGLSLRGYTLHLNVLMRSQDVWLGSPYDWFQFSQLLWTCARALDVQVGTYTHTTWSTHLYEINISDVDKLSDPPAESDWEWQPKGIGTAHSDIRDAWSRARALPYRDPHNVTISERWYREQLSPLVG